MTLNWPLWTILLIFGLAYWSFVLAATVLLLIVASLTHGWLRWTALVAALPCVGILAFALTLATDARQREADADKFELRTYQVLDRDQDVSGFHLPAGTELQWWDVDHRQLRSASPPAPIKLFGVQVSWISHAYDAEEWVLQLFEPTAIDGWTCEPIGVGMSPDGKLRHCRLAAGRMWKEWPIPAQSWLDLTQQGRVGLVLPTGASMAAPEIGRRITYTGGFAFNADGSLDNLYFNDRDPFRVAGLRLWNTVEWTYDPASYGQGRHRRAVTVRGTRLLDSGEGGTVLIRLADGKVTIPD